MKFRQGQTSQCNLTKPRFRSLHTWKVACDRAAIQAGRRGKDNMLLTYKKLDPHHMPHRKVTSVWIKYLNVKSERATLGKNTGEYPYGFNVGKNLLSKA